MKRIHWIMSILVFVIICGTLSFADIKNPGVPPIAETWLGIKTFVNGLVIKDPNTASINSTGDTRVHSLGVNCAADPNYSIKANGFTVDPNGSITTAADTDQVFTFGRGKMGYLVAGYEDVFAIGHIDCFNSGNYALYQNNAGTVVINSMNGQIISLRNIGLETAQINYNGLTMTAGKTITMDGLTIQAKSGALADDGTIVLPTIISGGMLKVWTEAEHGTFYINASGVVTFDSMSSNTIDSDTDGYLVVYDGGSTAVIKNRLGSEKTVNYVLEYK